MPNDVDTIDETNTKRQVVALVAILILLLLLLVAVGGFIWQVASPPSAEKNDIDTGSEGMRWVRSIYGWGPEANQKLTGPTDVAFGPDGVIWTNDPSNGRVLGFGPDGTLRHVLGDSPDSQLGFPSGISEPVVGEVFISDMNASQVFVVDRDGVLLRSWAVNEPRDVEVIEDRVYVSAAGGVGVFSLEGELLFSIGSGGGGPEQFDSPQSVTEDSEGVLYIADTLNSRVKTYSQDGELEWIFPDYASDVVREERESLAGPVSKDASGNAVFDLPTGAVIDASDRLLVIDAFNFSIMAVDTTEEGKLLISHGEQGRDDGKFWYPSDIAYDADRDWVAVADTKNNRVQLLEIDGTGGGGLLTGVRRGEYGPVWVCALPLLALLALLILLMLGRKRRSKSAEMDIDPDE